MKIKHIALWIFIGVVGRLIMHLPDATPLTSLCVLSPVYFSKRLSVFIMLITLMLSDFALHMLMHYPLYGLWTLFTYSGWLGVIFLGVFLAKKMTAPRALYFSCSGALFFWIWTNFGTWITTAMYPHSFSGLMMCYAAALPFLRNSVIASVVWTGVIVWVASPRVLKRMYADMLQ